MSVEAEALAVRRLREWLLAQLPAKVTALNLLRKATLKSALVGPFTFASGATLGLAVTPDTYAWSEVAFAAGSRTTAQVVTAINDALKATVATADSAGRLVLTSPTPPNGTTTSVISVRGGVNATDANTVFGWDLGGERRINYALVAPNSKGVCDGLPMLPEFGNNADGGSPIVIIIGDRSGRPIDNIRRDEYVVTTEVAIFRAEQPQQRSRDSIHDCVRCVREVLQTNSGRHLGVPADVMLVLEKECRVAALPFKFQAPKGYAGTSPLYDGASMLLEIRVFEVPAQT